MVSEPHGLEVGGNTFFLQDVEPCILGENHVILGLPSPCSLGSWKPRCSSNAELSLSSLEECRKDIVGRKGVKGLLLVSHEKVPRGFVLRTGDPGDTAEGAGNHYWEEPGAT